VEGIKEEEERDDMVENEKREKREKRRTKRNKERIWWGSGFIFDIFTDIT
jgi:hypothetical protein